MRRTAYFARFPLAMSLDDALACSHAGRCDDDVNELLKSADIRKQLDRIGPDAIRDELREYGAWDADELADDEQNRARIVWIAAGNIREERSES